MPRKPRQKFKFNKKLMTRFKKKELMDFVSKNNLPLDRPKSKYSKGEIVVHLLRLQRSQLYFKTFDSLEIKAPKELSDKQKQNLAGARQALSGGRGSGGGLNRIQKQKIPLAQQIDKKPGLEDLNNVKNVSAKKIITLSAKVSQGPTKLETIKEGDTSGQESDLNDLFASSDNQLNQQRQDMMDLIDKRKASKGLKPDSPSQPVIEEPEDDLVIIDPEEEEEQELDIEEIEFKPGEARSGQGKLSEEFENVLSDVIKKKITSAQIDKIARKFGIVFKKDQEGGSKRDKLRFIISNGGDEAGDFILDLEGNSKATFNEKINALEPVVEEPEESRELVPVKKKKSKKKAKRKSRVVIIPDN